MHWGSGWGARFDAKGHGVADCSHPVKGFATLDCLLPICCAAVKASMDKHGQALLACNPLPTSYPALTLLTFWVTFCVTFHLTNTHLIFSEVHPQLSIVIVDVNDENALKKKHILGTMLEVLVDHPDQYTNDDVDAVLREAELLAPSIMKQPEQRKSVSKVWPALLAGCGVVLSAALIAILGHDKD